MSGVLKVKGIFNVRKDGYVDMYRFLNFVRSKGHEIPTDLPIASMAFKVSLAEKVGKRRKLRKRIVEIYNPGCDCCGPTVEVKSAVR